MAYTEQTDWDMIRERTFLDTIPQLYLDEGNDLADRMNKGTMISWATTWQKNVSKNTRSYDFASMSIKGLSKAHVGETAYLIGCGPSLAANIEDLKRKEGIKISVLHALPYLLKQGVIPDYVVAIDARRLNSAWMSDGPWTLLTDIVTHPVTLRKWHGKKYFFRSHALEGLSFDKYTDFKDYISCGGNSLGAGYSIAHGMGCNRIVFVGMDLANGFQRHTNYANGWSNRKTGVDTFLTCDISGRGIYSLVRMHMYKMWYDMQACNHPEVEHINATQGGILGAYMEGNIKSMKQMKLEDVA